MFYLLTYLLTSKICIAPSRQANQKRCGLVIASLHVICSGKQLRLSATPKTTESVRRSCGCPETVPDLRRRIVERPTGEDGGHKWSVKQWSGSRAKCSGNLVDSNLFVKIQWGPTVLRVDSKGRQLERDPLSDR